MTASFFMIKFRGWNLNAFRFSGIASLKEKLWTISSDQLSAPMSRGTFELSESGYLPRFSICRYFNRDKEIGAWSRLAESIKESITAERRGGRKRESRDGPLTLWNLSEFFSFPSYYNIAFLYLHRDAANIRRGVGPLRRSFPLEIGSFSRTLLVAHRWNTANVNIDRLFLIVPIAESRNWIYDIQWRKRRTAASISD